MVGLSGTGTSAGQSAVISISPMNISFGNVVVGVTNSHMVTVSNTGSGSLNISNIAAAGSGFSVTGVSLPISIPAGQSINFNADIVPPAMGSLSGTITVTNNSPTPSMSVTMSGTGVSQGQPNFCFSTSINFGNVTVGVTSGQTVVVSNPGTTALTISNIAASGSGFSVTGTSLPITVPAGQSTSFNANVVPPTTGSLSGSVTITNNSATPSVVVALSATGTTAAQPTISVSPASVAFGNVNVGVSTPQTMTITNSGNAALTVSNITAAGSGYSVSGFTLPISIPAGQTSTFVAKFAPTVTGGSTGSVTIANNSATPSVVVALTGTGTFGTATRDIGFSCERRFRKRKRQCIRDADDDNIERRQRSVDRLKHYGDGHGIFSFRFHAANFNRRRSDFNVRSEICADGNWRGYRQRNGDQQ